MQNPWAALGREVLKVKKSYALLFTLVVCVPLLDW